MIEFEVVPEQAVEVRKVESLLYGLQTWINPKNGFRVLDLEYKADPQKRSPEWKIQSQAGVPKAKWNREFGSTWMVYEGKPVYGDYDEDVHVAKGTIIVNPRARLVSGWDGGPNDVNLAWVLGVMNPKDGSVLVIDEAATDDGDIYGIVEVAAAKLNLEWAKLGGFNLHVTDQSVFIKSNVVKNGKAMADVMREHGMNPIPGEQSYAKRRTTLERLLLSLHKSSEGSLVPKFRVHERCVLLRAALNGGYAYPANNHGGYNPKPLKNLHSHIANACEYMVSRLEMAHQVIPYEGKRLPKMVSSF
jgi:hypothetical protein